VGVVERNRRGSKVGFYLAAQRCFLAHKKGQKRKSIERDPADTWANVRT
jgi:hypothetical protein